MRSISYDIDPGGDIELILKSPNKQNIVPEDTLCPYDRSYLSESPNPPCLGRYEVFSELSSGDEGETPEAEIRMRVSSRHLILASHTFRAMLEGPWIESAPSSQPFRQISTEDWDALALAIVLDCIHGRHFKIPTEISPGLLTRISTIVDYYQCREAVQVHYRAWTENSVCRLAIETKEEDEMNVMWLFIAWVFHDEDRFRKMAEMFLRRSKGMDQFETNDLPVSGILEKLDGIRQTLFKKTSEALDALQTTLMGGEGCDEEDYCDSVLLPVLIREREYMTEEYDALIPPFDGCRLGNILEFIEYMDRPSREEFERKRPRRFRHRTNFPTCYCTLQERLLPTLSEIRHEVRSVCLDDFQPM